MNFTRNNESFDDDEAQNLASEWVQRLECSLLARLSEDKNSLEIGSSENCSVAFLDDLQADSRNERAEGACLVAAKEEVRPKKFIHAEYVDSRTECAHRVCAGTAQPCSSKDEEERHDKAQFPLNKPSPRVNLDLIRQKRLEYFEQDLDVLHKDNAMEWKSSRENSKFNVASLDAASADQGVSNRHDLRYDSGFDSHEVYENFSPRSCGEDDEIRLDLWGLKEAVKSGEIDLKPYMNLPCSDKRLVYGPKDSSRILHKVDLATSLACFPNQRSNTATLPKHLMCENTRVDETSQSQQQPVMDVEHPKRRSFPEPQISGSLYTCSDMFGSGDSLSGSKSVTSSEVYKRHKKTDLFDDKGNKHTEKRGKETILNELTEFMKTSNQLDTSAFSSVTKSSQHGGAANCLNKCSALATYSYETQDLYKEPSIRNFQLGSKGCTGDNNTATSYSSDDRLMSATKGNLKAKICPKCHEVNSKAANWCIECGSALITVKSSFLTVKQEKEYEKQCTQTKSLIWETLKSDTAAAGTSGMAKSRVSSTKEEHSVKSVEDLSNRLDNSLAFAEGRCCQSGLDYKRRWLRSSIAWSSYDSSELSKPSSLPIEQTPDQALRPTVNKHCSQLASSSESTGSQLAKGNSGRYSAQITQNNNVEWGFNEKENMEQRTNSEVHSSFAARKELHDILPTKSIVPPLNLQDVDSYERILTLIRSQHESEPLPYLCLPDELLLHIFSYLSQGMLVTSSLVCQQFYRIAMDNALWQAITITKKSCLTDGSLESIGKRHPASLTISYCHGETVTSQGLRSLFRQCGDTLEELDFSGCSGGELIGESILLHVAARCPKVKVVDASWSNVSDNGVRALVESVKRLECLCLNGCQAVTDGSLESVANRHGESLRIFEVFGCFNITPAGVNLVGHRCQHLQTLNIGQCHKITDSAIGSVVSGLHELENLDLRGCKQIRDTAVQQIVRHCSLLTSLVLANCPMITDTSLAEIANNLPGIRSLDICGCAKVTDNGIRALSRCCHRLELLDLSSTGVTHKSVTTLANYCSQSLCSLKLSFCTDVSDSTVKVLVKYCKRLTTLHLYGCKLIKDPRALKILNQNLTIEC